MMSSNAIGLLIYGIWLVAVVYTVGCLKSRRLIKIQPGKAILYMSSLAMIGVYSEIFCNTVYVHLFNDRLWYYNFLPMHHGYTSQYAPVIWGAMGLYIYLVHQRYEKNWTSRQLIILSAIFSIETVIMEGLAVASSRIFLSDYIFYYNPGHFLHLTSLQSIPFFFLVGILTLNTLRWFKTQPQFFTVLNTYVTSIILYFK
jgi:hypothetical protein